MKEVCLPPYRPTLALLERWLASEATPKAAIRFQQLSAPLAAKAVEDTAYYRYGVLLSRNEVGADVRRFSATVAGVPCGVSCAARAVSRRDAGHRNTRPQARRGRPRAARGAERDPG